MFRYFVADEYVRSIFQIDLEKLKVKGIKVIFSDLDNTLVGTSIKSPTTEIIAFLNKADELGFEVIIVSNNNKERVAYFAKDLTLTAHHKALKPLKFKIKKVLKKFDKSQVVMIGDQLMTDVLVGKRLGLYTILVEPIHLVSDEKSTKINRQLEQLVIKKLKKRQLPIPTYLDKNN